MDAWCILGRRCFFGDLLAKQRIQLFGDVVLLVFDVGLSQFNRNVGVGFSIDVCRVQVSGLVQKRDTILKYTLTWGHVSVKG